MTERETIVDRMLMGAPLGIAAAAVAYGGGHWVLVAMLSVVSLLLTASASFDSIRNGALAQAVVGLAVVVVPIGFAGLVLLDRGQEVATPNLSAPRKAEGSQLERNTGSARDGVMASKSGRGETDLVAFAEVAQLLKTARRSDVEHPDVRYAQQRVRAWEAIGVREFSAVDPATGRPAMPPARWDNLAKARKSFEDKLATKGRQAMLTVEEAAWAAFTLAGEQ